MLLAQPPGDTTLPADGDGGGGDSGGGGSGEAGGGEVSDGTEKRSDLSSTMADPVAPHELAPTRASPSKRKEGTPHIVQPHSYDEELQYIHQPGVSHDGGGT